MAMQGCSEHGRATMGCIPCLRVMKGLPEKAPESTSAEPAADGSAVQSPEVVPPIIVDNHPPVCPPMHHDCPPPSHG
jgi:hypothetical protein